MPGTDSGILLIQIMVYNLVYYLDSKSVSEFPFLKSVYRVRFPFRVLVLSPILSITIGAVVFTALFKRSLNNPDPFENKSIEKRIPLFLEAF